MIVEDVPDLDPCPCGADEGDNWFDGELCACGLMHTRCAGCGQPLEPCKMERSA